ncbi:MAG: hypothetical protein JXA94_01370 [Parachlamydiales bacterium]|nr:hypothetical protein [Parachlamydiales bacterium]
MRKKIFALITLLSFCFSSLAYAEAKEVPQAAKESSSIYESKNWRPWAVAIITIVIAAVGITLVAKDK